MLNGCGIAPRPGAHWSQLLIPPKRARRYHAILAISRSARFDNRRLPIGTGSVAWIWLAFPSARNCQWPRCARAGSTARTAAPLSTWLPWPALSARRTIRSIRWPRAGSLCSPSRQRSNSPARATGFASTRFTGARSTPIGAIRCLRCAHAIWAQTTLNRLRKQTLKPHPDRPHRDGDRNRQEHRLSRLRRAGFMTGASLVIDGGITAQWVHLLERQPQWCFRAISSRFPAKAETTPRYCPLAAYSRNYVLNAPRGGNRRLTRSPQMRWKGLGIAAMATTARNRPLPMDSTIWLPATPQCRDRLPLRRDNTMTRSHRMVPWT